MIKNFITYILSFFLKSEYNDWRRFSTAEDVFVNDIKMETNTTSFIIKDRIKNLDLTPFNTNRVKLFRTSVVDFGSKYALLCTTGANGGEIDTIVYVDSSEYKNLPENIKVEYYFKDHIIQVIE